MQPAYKLGPHQMALVEDQGAAATYGGKRWLITKRRQVNIVLTLIIIIELKLHVGVQSRL